MDINVGLLISYIVSLLVMIGLPVALVIFVVRRFKVSWWVILTGVVTYFVSQAIHYPVLSKTIALLQDGTLPVPADKWIPLYIAVIMGFLAALFEEGARYFGFLIVRKKAKRIESGIGLGIGHGGMESLGFALWPWFPLFGGILIELVKVVFYNPGAEIAKGVAMEQVQYYVSYYAQIWANPWHVGLLPGVERLISLSTQILLAILVWKAVKSRNFGWFALAFFYHMLVVGISVFLQYSGWSYWPIEGIMAIFMLANLYLIYYFWKEESEKDEDEDEDDEDDEDEEDDEDDEENDENDDDVDVDEEEEVEEEEDEEDKPEKA